MSESSFDGSLNESYDSEAPDPAIMFAPSPDNTGDISFGATLPMHRSQNDAIKTLPTTSYNRDEEHEEDYEYGLNESADSGEQSRSNILDHLGAVDSIPHCNKVSSFLSQMGYPSVQIVSSDIDSNTRWVVVVPVPSSLELFFINTYSVRNSVRSPPL
jgi:hypothetical protein